MKSRKLITIWRVFGAGILGFARNAWLSLAALATMIVTLSIILASVVINATFSHTIEQIRSKIDVSIYLKDDITIQSKDQLLDQIKSMPNVKEVEYISKEAAKSAFLELFKDNIDLQLAAMSADNKIPATVRVKLYNPDMMDDLKQFLDQPEITELQSSPTSYSGSTKEAIDSITKATSFFRTAGIVGVLVFAGISILIIFNTIQMAIFNRRDELSIMSLLGASRWFIRGPFLVESMLIGVLSAGVSIAICYVLFVVSSKVLTASTFGIMDVAYSRQFFSDNLLLICLGQVGLGVLIGVMSSYIATYKYLRRNR
ncbi:ABC transporter permease [Candidatus Saccharibacteria bacterium]|nr:ABC transporter permease [Candidatus Saccharibacteria bacterium]